MQQAVLFLVCGGVARCRTTTVLFFSLLIILPGGEPSNLLLGGTLQEGIRFLMTYRGMPDASQAPVTVWLHLLYFPRCLVHNNLSDVGKIN